MEERKQTPSPSHHVTSYEGLDLSREQERQVIKRGSHDQQTQPCENARETRSSAILIRQREVRERQLECKTAKTTAIIVPLFIFLVYPRIIVIIYSCLSRQRSVLSAMQDFGCEFFCTVTRLSIRFYLKVCVTIKFGGSSSSLCRPVVEKDSLRSQLTRTVVTFSSQE